MDSDDDKQVVYEDCSDKIWKSLRGSLWNNYDKVGQSAGFSSLTRIKRDVEGSMPELGGQEDDQSVTSYYTCFSDESSSFCDESSTSSESSVSSASITVGFLATKMCQFSVDENKNSTLPRLFGGGINSTRSGDSGHTAETPSPRVSAAFSPEVVAEMKPPLTYCHRSVIHPFIQENKLLTLDRTNQRTRFGCVRRCGPPVSMANSSPEAHNLPRYIPTENKLNFMRWLDCNRELVLHKIKDVATGLVSCPLGCTYDSALDTFVFTRYDSVLFAASDGQVLDSLTLKGFQNPYAVCIIQPGAAMAILDRSKLYLYEPRLSRLSVIASGLNARHRALSYTSDGNLVTVERRGTQLFLIVFDATEYNKVVKSVPYPYAADVPPKSFRQPCFADSVGNQIFFTDLRSNTLTCMRFAKNRFITIYSQCMQQKPEHGGGKAPDRFVFMSGVRCDGFGHLLVADAKMRMLKLLTASGCFLKCVRVADGASFPYCSTFGISPSGLLLACDRRSNRLILYRFGAK